LEALKDKTMTLKQISDKAKLSKEELNVCLGALRKKAAVMITKEKNELVVKSLDQAKKLLEEAGWKKKLDGYRYKGGDKLSLILMTTAQNRTRELVEVFCWRYDMRSGTCGARRKSFIFFIPMFK